MLVAMVLTVIFGAIATLSLAFSIFSLIHVAKYENIRIRSKDNQESLDAFDSRFKSLENRMYRYFREGGAQSATDKALAHWLNSQVGNGAANADPDQAYDEYEDD